MPIFVLVFQWSMGMNDALLIINRWHNDVHKQFYKISYKLLFCTLHRL